MKLIILLAVLSAAYCADSVHFSPNQMQYERLTDKFNGNSALISPGLFEELNKIYLNANLLNETSGITAIINEYADKLFENIQHIMVHNGYDPIQMIPLGFEFKYKPFIITYSGEMKLKNGWLQDLSSLHRTGDVTLHYERQNKKVQLVIPMGFNDLMFNYEYSIKLMHLGPTGGVEGKVRNLRMKIVMSFDFEIPAASFDNYEITHSGHIDIKFTGHILFDWMLDLVSGMTTTVLKGAILGIVELIVKGTMNMVVDFLNDAIKDLVNPTTIAPTDVTPTLGS